MLLCCTELLNVLLHRCGPCQRIAPIFQQLSTKYPRAVFLKVDVDKCQETAAAQGVSAMPTFIFYRNRVSIYQYTLGTYSVCIQLCACTYVVDQGR